MPVPYILFVKAIFENLEIIYLNRQFLLISVLKSLRRALRMPVNVSQWLMDIGNFQNFLCDCVFYLSKSLMVVAYIYALLFKNIVNLTLVFFVCLFVFFTF